MQNKLKNHRDKLVALFLGTHQQLTKIDFDIGTLGNIDLKVSSEVGNF